MPADLAINDIGALSYGIVVANIQGWLDAPQRETQRIVIPGRAGERALRDAQESSRPLTISGLMRGTSPANARTKFDTLKLALEGSTVKLSMPDGAARHIYATLQSVSSPSIAGQFAQKDLPVEVRALAMDPYFRDDALTSLGGGAALPLGTAPVRPVLSLTGAAATGITLTFRDHTAATVATMSFPQLTLTAPDVLVVDCDLFTAKKNGANVLALLSSASDFFEIDPLLHANYGSSLWPSIIANVGTLTVSYRRQWR